MTFSVKDKKAGTSRGAIYPRSHSWEMIEAFVKI